MISQQKQTVVFITGGATGIGAAAVRQFHALGCLVAFIDTNSTAATSLVSELEREGDHRQPSPSGLLYVSGDIRQKDDIVKAVVMTENTFGPINIILANAGIHRHNTVLDITDRDLEDVISTNLYGTINTLRIALPSMLKAKGNRSVVITASDQSLVGKPNAFAYGLTKGALGQMTKSLAIDLAPYHIRVNAVCPATIHTPMVDKIFDHIASEGHTTAERLWTEEDRDYLTGSCGTPDQVARLIVFLALDNLSGFCTGSLYPIDGGLTAS